MRQRVWEVVKRRQVAVCAVVFVLCGTSVAMAGGSGAATGKKYYACVTEVYRTINLTTARKGCPDGQRIISFNARGQRGLRGRQGLAGPAGEPGAAGAKGDAGAAGAAGAKGDTGATGAVGPEGETGAQGEPGEQGDPGPQGEAGPQGEDGATGPAGQQGPPGPTGLTGAPGPPGTAGDRGPIGPTGNTGAQGPVGPAGPAGPAGPTGPAGGALVVRDGAGAALGRVVSSSREDVTVVTSTGYIVTIEWTGGFDPAQIYYTGQCGSVGTGYLNNGDPSNDPAQYISDRWVVFSASLNSLVVPATVANGTSASVQVTAQSIDNPDCSNFTAAGRAGWQLRTITRAAVGLPATIATPLRLE